MSTSCSSLVNLAYQPDRRLAVDANAGEACDIPDRATPVWRMEESSRHKLNNLIRDLQELKENRGEMERLRRGVREAGELSRRSGGAPAPRARVAGRGPVCRRGGPTISPAIDPATVFSSKLQCTATDGESAWILHGTRAASCLFYADRTESAIYSRPTTDSEERHLLLYCHQRGH